MEVAIFPGHKPASPDSRPEHTLPDVRPPAHEKKRIALEKVAALVVAASGDVPYVLAQSRDGRQYTLNKFVLKELWGHLSRGDYLHLLVQREPGQPSRILRVERH